jgi:hypothetical protein
MESELQGESLTPPVPASGRAPNRGRRFLLVGAAAVGAAIGGAGIANAATSSSTSTPASSSAAATTAPGRPATDPAKMANGPGETLLTGTTADEVKAAALAADPGATIIRVETDSAGSPYEAHITKADGTEATLKIDTNFKVTSTEQGFGSGPHGQAPPNGDGPYGGAPSGAAPSA